MIVDNCWNGGVVIGRRIPVTRQDIIGMDGRQTVNGAIAEGNSEDPFATLAWLANLFAERDRDSKAGMIVITGSLIPTFSIRPATAASSRSMASASARWM